MADGYSGVDSRVRLVCFLNFLSKNLQENPQSFVDSEPLRSNAVLALQAHAQELMYEFCLSTTDVDEFMSILEENAKLQRLLNKAMV